MLPIDRVIDVYTTGSDKVLISSINLLWLLWSMPHCHTATHVTHVALVTRQWLS